MTFSNGFSEGFNKTSATLPENSIGLLTEQFYNSFGTKDIGTVTEEFDEFAGEWNMGDLPP